MLEYVLDKINLPIIIWKTDKSGELVCDFVNDRVDFVKMRDKFKYHHKNVDINKLPEFSYHLNSEIICFSNMLNGTYVEIRYPYISNNIQLLSTISKKLREPLTNIISILSILDQLTLTCDNNFHKSYLPIIQQSLYSIIYVANDIVDLISIENNTIKLSIYSFSLHDMVCKLVDMFKDKCNQKGIKLISKVEIDCPYIINNDQVRLLQILSIILKNAIYYTCEGLIQIDVSLSKQKQLVFVIRDTGKGMTNSQKEKVDYILNICYSLSHLKYEGFGLFIAKRLALILGGSIHYQSELGTGSVFYLKIEDK